MLSNGSTTCGTREIGMLEKPLVWFVLALVAVAAINLTGAHQQAIRLAYEKGLSLLWQRGADSPSGLFPLLLKVLAGAFLTAWYLTVMFGPYVLLFWFLVTGIRRMRKADRLRKLVWVAAVSLLAAGSARAQQPMPQSKPETKAESKPPAKTVKKVPVPPKAHRVRSMPRPLDMDRGVPEVYTAPSYATVIELPEPIVQFAEGDAKKWVIACGVGVRVGVDAGSKSLCVVKPGRSNERLSTSLVVTGASGALYPFHLVPAEDEIDIVAFVKSTTPRLIAAKLTDPNFVPKSDLAAALAGEREALAQVSELKESLEGERRRAEALVDPHKIMFDYQLDRGRFHKAAESAMFEDGGRTFLLTAEPPVIHIDGKELAPSCVAKMCVVPGVLERGYFTVGGKKTKFERRKPAHG
jgi:hypothetical protein